MAEKKWTVAGLCRCGCDDSFIVHVEASDVDGAVKRAGKAREGREGTVVAVMPGWHKSELLEPVEVNGGY